MSAKTGLLPRGQDVWHDALSDHFSRSSSRVNHSLFCYCAHRRLRMALFSSSITNNNHNNTTSSSIPRSLTPDTQNNPRNDDSPTRGGTRGGHHKDQRDNSHSGSVGSVGSVGRVSRERPRVRDVIPVAYAKGASGSAQALSCNNLDNHDNLDSHDSPDSPDDILYVYL